MIVREIDLADDADRIVAGLHPGELDAGVGMIKLSAAELGRIHSAALTINGSDNDVKLGDLALTAGPSGPFASNGRFSVTGGAGVIAILVLGLTVGDGALSYGAEFVAETYYSLKLADGLFVTADYQFIGNPGYNA